MKETIRIWLRRALLAFALVCAFVLMYRVIENAGGEESYDHAEDIAFNQDQVQLPAPVQSEPTQAPAPVAYLPWVPAQVEPDEHMQALAETDLAALQQVNPDVIGWVMIPDTKINYPILQGEDNEFYLKHTWERIKNPMGSVFMEARNDYDFSDFNTILYAHNMNSGSMFADLKDYSATWFRESHPYVYLVTGEGVFRYEVFAFHQAPVDSFVYGLSFNQKETRENFIASALEASYADMGKSPVYSDRMLTLSTCTGGTHDRRWVVHAFLTMVPPQ